MVAEQQRKIATKSIAVFSDTLC